MTLLALPDSVHIATWNTTHLNEFEQDEKILEWISQQLNVPPKKLSLIHESGKSPVIQGFLETVYLSLSHTQHWLGVALSLTQSIGIDLELVRTDLSLLEMAEAHFAEAEVKFLQQLASEEDRRTLFFRLWTCKEAILKAWGYGIIRGMSDPNLAEFCDALLKAKKSETPSHYRNTSFEVWSSFLEEGPLAFAVALATMP